MGILIKMAKSRAIKKIAKKLPSFLVSGYGGGEFYTYGQVNTAMKETGCNEKFIDHAYAMFCDRENFSEISTADYDALHEQVAEICFNGDSNFNAASFSSEFGGGADGGGSGGGSD
ncbi:MAG: hypothetical protein GY862_03325 [Gammaproteobacteria bacterium]|nr:hypothetical protein [Gammaproteobacteria bacterium]